MIVIDLFGEEDMITVSSDVPEETFEEKNERFKKLREEWMRRAPQPTLQIVPIVNK